MTLFTASAFADQCPRTGINGFYLGVSAGYRFQVAKDKKTQKAYTVKGTYVTKTAAENRSDALTVIGEELKEFKALVGITDVITASSARNGTGTLKTVTTAFNERVTELNTLLSPFGIQIEIPSGNWTYQETPGTGGNDVVVTLVPPSKYKINDSLTFLPADNYDLVVAQIDDTLNSNDFNEGIKDYVDPNNFALVTLAAQKTGAFSDTLDETSTSVAESTTETRSHNQQGAFALRIGYDHSFNKFYIGGELFGEMICGKLPIQKIADLTATQNAFSYGSQNYSYTTAMPTAAPKITLKQKWALGFVAKPGVTFGNFAFYVPLEVNLTKYDVKFERSADNFAKYTAYPTYLSADGKKVTVTEISSADASSDAATSLTYKKGKTKLGFAFGLGTIFQLSDHFSIDFRGMYSPNAKITVNTQNFSAIDGAKYTVDPAQFGEKHRIKLSTIKLSLGFTYHF